MPSAIEATARDRLIAGYAALATAVHVVEAGFPTPIPGVKPGLANVVVLVVLLRHGWAAAAWVAGLRVLAASLLTGTLLAPSFWLSAAGALASVLALAAGVAWSAAWPAARLSALGLSVVSALAHMGGQFAVAHYAFIGHAGLLALLPPLMAAALAFGLLVGTAAAALLARMPPAPRSA
jgi:heptaprenyl diphosphate synthase